MLGKNIIIYILIFLFSSLSFAADPPPTKLKLRDPAAAQSGGGQTNITDPTTGMELVFVKGGCYMMGSNEISNAKPPVHEVCVSDFYMGKYEVTIGQYTSVMGKKKSSRDNEYRPDYPESFSWIEAQEFTTILNKKSNRQYRLPTEAEWEYAARSGGKNEKWAGTSDVANLGKFAWYTKNSGKMVHRVGLKKANGLGLHDMSGNKEEWCQDWYNEAYYEDSPKDNPLGPDIGEGHVMRGGHINSDDFELQTVYRLDGRDFNLAGFRLVLSVR